VVVHPEYRWAIISLKQDHYKKWDAVELGKVMAHEVQHVALYPLDELHQQFDAMLLALGAYHDDMKNVTSVMQTQVQVASRIANEKLRSLLGRLTDEGNNYHG
jgi:hypothetical protein